jgi:hypothetical protein
MLPLNEILGCGIATYFPLSTSSGLSSTISELLLLIDFLQVKLLGED